MLFSFCSGKAPGGELNGYSTVIHPIKIRNTPLGIEVVLCCLSKLYFIGTSGILPNNIQKLHKNSICLYKTSEMLKKLELNTLIFIPQYHGSFI